MAWLKFSCLRLGSLRCLRDSHLQILGADCRGYSWLSATTLTVSVAKERDVGSIGHQPLELSSRCLFQCRFWSSNLPRPRRRTTSYSRRVLNNGRSLYYRWRSLYENASKYSIIILEVYLLVKYIRTIVRVLSG